VSAVRYVKIRKKFALKNRQFNPALELKRTAEISDENEIRESEMKVLLCKT